METYLFVYGTLKRGYLLGDRAAEMGMRYRMDMSTIERFGLWDLGGYPCLVPDAPSDQLHRITGELVLINQKANKFISQIESGAGYFPILVNCWFGGKALTWAMSLDSIGTHGEWCNGVWPDKANLNNGES